MPAYGRAVLGGTFDHLHAGHAALLGAAFRLGRTVAVGLTTDGYLTEHRKPLGDRIEPFRTRRRRLAAWIRRHYPGRSWEIVPLGDVYGRSVEPGVNVLVVSADTVGGGRRVNAERRRRGLPSVPLEVVPLVLADDLRPVSSRRIRAREIDPDGRRISSIHVGLTVEDPLDRPAASRAVRRAFPRARITDVPYRRAAIPSVRARTSARAASKTADLGLAVAARRRGRRALWLAAGGLAIGSSATGDALGAAVSNLLRPHRGRKGFGSGGD